MRSSKATRSAPFILTLLLFALPFVEVRCAYDTYKVSGYGAAFGSATHKNERTGQEESTSGGGSPTILLAICATAIAAVAATRKSAASRWIAASMGTLSFIVLLRAYLSEGQGLPAYVQVIIKIPYLLAVLALGVGAAINGSSAWALRAAALLDTRDKLGVKEPNSERSASQQPTQDAG